VTLFPNPLVALTSTFASPSPSLHRVVVCRYVSPIEGGNGGKRPSPAGPWEIWGKIADRPTS